MASSKEGTSDTIERIRDHIKAVASVGKLGLDSCGRNVIVDQNRGKEEVKLDVSSSLNSSFIKGELSVLQPLLVS